MRTAFSLIFIVIISLVGMIMFHMINQSFRTHSDQTLGHVVEANLDLLHNHLDNLDRFTNLIANDPDVQRAVGYRNRTEQIDYAIELKNQRLVHERLQQLTLVPYIKNAYIIGESGHMLYSYKKNVRNEYNFYDAPWFSDVIENDRFSDNYFTGFHPTDYLLNHQEKQTISIIRQIQNTFLFAPTDRSYLVYDIDLSAILLENTLDQDLNILISNGTEWVYLPESLTLSHQQLMAVGETLSDSDVDTVIEEPFGQGADLLVRSNVIRPTGWQMIGVKKMSSVTAFEWNLLTVILTVIIASAILITIVSGLLSKSMLVPMRHVIDNFHQISKGHYDVTFDKSSSDEIKELSDAAETMVHNITSLTAHLVDEQKKVSEEQMRVLQNQINPHFLNNVLQSIKALAINKESEKISHLSTLLGKMLEYAVYQPYARVPLKVELTYLEHYLAIQNIRFDAHIRLDLVLPKKFEDILIPKLLLQPLIENAILHGLSGKKTGQITLLVEEEGDDLVLVMTDDGRGMSADELQALRVSLDQVDASQTNIQSIGLANVYKRLTHEFTRAAYLAVYATEGTGTTVVISLPKRLLNQHKEENDDTICRTR
ncbi:two-component system, sensor histidine kinase YesM [Halolactibacillus miurensis]|nr:two-component system, sensor histidine kinase YesM [Halolactibacillus miurensis]